MQEPPEQAYDAVVLSGGRSARLGGVPKASLRIMGQTLLARTCDAAGSARRIIVVGGAVPEVAERVEHIRDEPPFGGPAAGVAAAVVHLLPDPPPWVLVLACDMPQIAEALPLLFAGAAETGASVLAREGGRDQPLAALYRWTDLSSAVEPGQVRNLSMRKLLARVNWSPIDVPAGSTHDVDTWADARELGVEEPANDN